MSQPLAQQELMTPPAVRRLIVRPGHTSWYGADLGTTRLALAFVASDGRRGSRTVPFAPLEGSARLSHIYAETRSFCAAVIREGWPRPGFVQTEQTSGSKQTVNLPFIMAAGALHAGMYDGFCDALGFPVLIETCVSGHWKAVACGSGRISKPQKVKGKPRPSLEEYGVFRWARSNGWAPIDWNEADAAGMAECARREVALEPR